MKNELLGLPLKPKLQKDAVPSLFLHEISQEEETDKSATIVKKTKRGRIVKRKLPPQFVLTVGGTVEGRTKRMKALNSATKACNDLVKNDHGYSVPKGIFSIRQRILKLKEELANLRQDRQKVDPFEQPSISITPMEDIEAVEDHLDSKREVSADDVRNHFRSAVGLVSTFTYFTSEWI